MRLLIKAAAAFCGFVIGLVVCYAGAALVSVGYGAPPRPSISPLVLIGAISTAIVGWRRAPTPEAVHRWLAGPLSSKAVRLTVALSIPWMLSVWLATYAFKLFAYYDDGARFYALLLAPPAIFFVAMLLLQWASKAPAPAQPVGQVSAHRETKRTPAVGVAIGLVILLGLIAVSALRDRTEGDRLVQTEPSVAQAGADDPRKTCYEDACELPDVPSALAMPVADETGEDLREHP